MCFYSLYLEVLRSWVIGLINSKKRESNLEALNLKSDATNDDIKLAYRRMAKKTHPDLNKNDPEASKKFLEVQNAYNELKDSNKPKIKVKAFRHRDPSTWSNFNSLIREIFSDNFFLSNEERKIYNVPLSQPEAYVDLKELVKRKRKYKNYF